MRDAERKQWRREKNLVTHNWKEDVGDAWLKGKSSSPKLILKQQLILTDISLFLFHVPFFTFQEFNIAYPR